MRVAKSSLLALCGVCAALAAPASAAGLWKPGLQQKTCATLEWRSGGKPSALFVYNTDGSMLSIGGTGMAGAGIFAVPDALSQEQAIVVAACSPNVKAPHGHTYWVSVFDPNAPTPSANRIVISYPPSDAPPVFKNPPPKGLWTTGMQTKTCAAIEWLPGDLSHAESVWLHNTDGS